MPPNAALLAAPPGSATCRADADPIRKAPGGDCRRAPGSMLDGWSRSQPLPSRYRHPTKAGLAGGKALLSASFRMKSLAGADSGALEAHSTLKSLVGGRERHIQGVASKGLVGGACAGTDRRASDPAWRAARSMSGGQRERRFSGPSRWWWWKPLPEAPLPWRGSRQGPNRQKRWSRG